MNAAAEHLQLIRGGAAVTFQRGDHAELADRRLDTLATKRDHLVSDQGSIWRYCES